MLRHERREQQDPRQDAGPAVCRAAEWAEFELSAALQSPAGGFLSAQEPPRSADDGSAAAVVECRFAGEADRACAGTETNEETQRPNEKRCDRLRQRIHSDRAG